MNRKFQIKLAELGYLVYDKKNKGSIKDLALSNLLKLFLELGFTLDYKSLRKLKSYSDEDINIFYTNSYKILKKLKGADANHIVFYKNFPNLEDFNEEDYVVRALLHYMTVSEEDYGYMAQDIADIVRNEENIEINPITLKIISEKEAEKIIFKYYTSLLEANKAISIEEFENIKSIIDEYGNVIKPKEIPFHLNLTLFIYNLLDNNESPSDNIVKIDFYCLSTVTDVLRIYCIASGYNDLSNNVKFISLKRNARRKILEYLNELVCHGTYKMDDFHMHEALWKRAFKMLHVGEYKNRYPFIYSFANSLRTGDYETYNSMVEKAINNCDKSLYLLLKEKPGYFARRLDSLLRNQSLDQNKILKSFSDVASSISTSVLIGIWEYYKNRNDLSDNRYIMYRKNHNYISLSNPETRVKYSEDELNKIISVIEKTLSDRFGVNKRLDDVYVDECMKNYTIPLNNVNASSGLKTLPFASKIKLEESEMPILRFFTHWKNIDKKRVDIDLSMELYDENLEYKGSLAWHNMSYGHKFESYHSGDVTSAPNGASEFIDLNYIEARKHFRYAVICNSSFTCQNYCDIPECFSGIMFRSKSGKRGEIFDPKTVVTRFDLTSRDCYSNVAYIVDIKNMELIWCDMPIGYANVAAYNNDASIIKRATAKHMSLYDLVMMHHKHINFVDKEKAQIIIDDKADSILSPFRNDSIFKWMN